MTGPDPVMVLARFTELARRICEHDQLILSAGTRLEDIPGIDSLRLLQAVAQLEETFRVEIDVVALNHLILVRDVVDAMVGARPATDREPDSECTPK